MSKDFDETNRGVLFLNHKKKNDRSPNYTGKINIDGEERWLSGWVNEIRSGKRAGEKMVSLSVGDLIDNGSSGSGNSGGDNQQDLDDDIPF